MSLSLAVGVTVVVRVWVGQDLSEEWVSPLLVCLSSH